MKNPKPTLHTLLGAISFAGALALPLSATPEAQRLWPNQPPGPKPAQLEPRSVRPGENNVAGRPISIVHNVTDPTFTVYKPDPAKDTGAAVVVFPGGGYWVLAIDLEGTEVCEWLNSVGVTAILVEYRVPRMDGEPPHERPLQDGQRAVSVVRSRAAELGIDPNRIGVLGFSAGANLAAFVSNTHATRAYPRVDARDDVSCRPDFCLLVYPAYLVEPKESTKVRPDLPVAEGVTPPTFLVISQDDDVGVGNAVFYYAAMCANKVPGELHIYPRGGHGYGLRPVAELPVTTWNHRAHEWLKATGLLKPRS